MCLPSLCVYTVEIALRIETLPALYSQILGIPYGMETDLPMAHSSNACMVTPLLFDPAPAIVHPQ